MNYGIVSKVLGNLLLFEAGILVFPLLISLYTKESDTLAFVYSIAIILFVGLMMSKVPRPSKKIKAKEALSIVAGGWLLVSFFGSLPFVLSGSIPSMVDAFFETVSGLTTTGATLINDIEALPKGILFWRSLTHWLGGMGILVLTLAILPAIGVGGFQIFKAESPGPVSDKLVPRMKDTAVILYTVYLGITVLQIILLYIGGMSLYESVIHTFGTVGTGGFSTRNDSIGAFGSNYIHFVIAIFMIASGVNFSLYYDLYKGRWKDVVKNSELKFYFSIIAGAVFLITINLYGNVYTSLFETFRNALFQVGAIITTTGYTTVDYEQWNVFSQLIIFLLMFVGGCAGSTGGSIKNIRLLVLVKMIKREISKILHPRAYVPIKLNGKSISQDVVSSVTGFFFLYILIFIVGTLLISLEGIGMVSAASSIAATLGNIGPGFEMVGPTQTYSDFSAWSKMLFSLMMLFGRLELFTIFILLMPSFWKK
ncbi:trk system potassium uptake protein TrkH [Natranaerovirga hydrolytica]|uniref:Trk system potassium uptake protein TrkH n=1 Tax=Natranaerovirga hydrolytica TaxID=680378 RepID=A0A4R1MLA3_9FIRM|nr:TrkH family potassium uptake protein [Natranaerovirga hydrolytica]TCK92622.1 trk system potassium uptake protein TrkH [Natranaerovirga hydrolytica]